MTSRNRPRHYSCQCLNDVLRVVGEGGTGGGAQKVEEVGIGCCNPATTLANRVRLCIA